MNTRGSHAHKNAWVPLAIRVHVVIGFGFRAKGLGFRA